MAEEKVAGRVYGETDILARMAVLEERLATLAKELDKCVTRQEFWPVKTIVYSLAGAMGLTVAAAVLKLVITAGSA